MSGLVGYLSGLSAEDSVAALYASKGAEIAARRWRGSQGEIDLVARADGEVIFVEVKKARGFAEAAHRLTDGQIERIFGAATEFLADEPDGQDTNVRFDLALVDSTGQTQIIENALGY